MKPVVRVNEWWLSRDADGFAMLWHNKPECTWGSYHDNAGHCEHDDDANSGFTVREICGGYHGVRPGQCKKIRVKTTIEAEVVE